MWPWVIVALICLLPILLMFWLFRRSVSVAHSTLHPGGGAATDQLASLVEQLEDAADAIIARLEVKQNEVEAMVRLLDAKLEALQMTMQAQSQKENMTIVASNKSEQSSKAADDSLGRHDLVRTLNEAGLDPLTISQRTGMRLDEVRLIINLHGCRSKSAR